MSMVSQVFFGASGMRRALFIYGRTTALRAAAPDRAHAEAVVHEADEQGGEGSGDPPRRGGREAQPLMRERGGAAGEGAGGHCHASEQRRGPGVHLAGLRPQGGPRLTFASHASMWRVLTPDRWAVLEAMTGAGPAGVAGDCPTRQP